MAPNSKEIIDLLSRLKAQTPDYPTEMMAARKASFLKEAAAIKLQIKGRGGEGGQTGGSSGASSAASGSTTTSGITFQALIGFGMIAVMLIGAFIVKEQDHDFWEKETVFAVEENYDETILPLTGAVPQTLTPVSTEMIPTVPTPETDITNQTVNDETDVAVWDDIAELKEEEELQKEKKPNPGLHLGQAEGTPAAPGQGNPGNINQPSKPDKPAKPDKPNKPNKP